LAKNQFLLNIKLNMYHRALVKFISCRRSWYAYNCLGYTTYIWVSDVFKTPTNLFFILYLNIRKKHQKWIKKQLSKSWANETLYFNCRRTHLSPIFYADSCFSPTEMSFNTSMGVSRWWLLLCNKPRKDS